MTEDGFEYSLGEVERGEVQAIVNSFATRERELLSRQLTGFTEFGDLVAAIARAGRGIKNSLHTMRLAIDINLFKDGFYLPGTEDHKLFGEWWEKQHELCRWGGRFKDGNHYSVEHMGRA